MDKLNNILFNVSLGLVLILSATLVAGLIIVCLVQLAHYIDKLFYFDNQTSHY